MISEFRGKYSFLSNFYPLHNPLRHRGIDYITIEHFYIAMKTVDKESRKEVAKHPLKGLKKFGRSVILRDNWDDIKLQVMEAGLRYKFSDNNKVLQRMLLRTKDLHIQEGNMWGDKFWGVCLKTGHGSNHLGKLLMKIREDLRG